MDQRKRILQNGGGEVAKLKAVRFNPETEVHLLKYADQLDNFSGWVKDKIRESLNPEEVLSAEQLRAIQELIRRSMAGYQPVVDSELKNAVEDYF